jgi:ABC-type glutathione transport system ATPase component
VETGISDTYNVEIKSGVEEGAEVFTQVQTESSWCDMLVKLKDVYKIYSEGLESEVRALDGVSLEIERGNLWP